jgi:hypothetical protein
MKISILEFSFFWLFYMFYSHFLKKKRKMMDYGCRRGRDSISLFSFLFFSVRRLMSHMIPGRHVSISLLRCWANQDHVRFSYIICIHALHYYSNNVRRLMNEPWTEKQKQKRRIVSMRKKKKKKKKKMSIY